MSRNLTNFRSPTERRQFLGLSAAYLACLAAACRRAKDRAYSRGHTLIIAVSDVNAVSDTTGLDHDIFLPLARTAENGDYVPRLAESWHHSPDYREWTYHLRRNVRWHDGVPVTADDVKFTIDLRVAVDGNFYGAKGVEVLDAYTVRVRALPHYQDEAVYYPST